MSEPPSLPALTPMHKNPIDEYRCIFLIFFSDTYVVTTCICACTTALVTIQLFFHLFIMSVKSDNILQVSSCAFHCFAMKPLWHLLITLNACFKLLLDRPCSISSHCSCSHFSGILWLAVALLLLHWHMLYDQCQTLKYLASRSSSSLSVSKCPQSWFTLLPMVC